MFGLNLKKGLKRLVKDKVFSVGSFLIQKNFKINVNQTYETVFVHCLNPNSNTSKK